MNTENNQPEWVKEVLKIVTRTQEKAVTATADFNAVAAKHGMVYAIQWKASSVAVSEGLRLEISWLGDLLTSKKHTADFEQTAKLALAEIENRKQQLLNSMRAAASTSAFANAVENAQLEARARAFDSFGGEYSQIRYIIEHRAA